MVLGWGGVIPRHLHSIGLDWLQGLVLFPRAPGGIIMCSLDITVTVIKEDWRGGEGRRGREAWLGI